MAQPPAYNRTKDFSADYGDQTDNQAINNELDAVATSINAIRGNLAKIQRDDGGLRDGIVTKDALDPELKDELYAEFSGNINDSVLKAQQAAVEANNAAQVAVDASVTAASARDAAQTAQTSAQVSASAASISEAAAAGSEASAQTSATSAVAAAVGAWESATAAAGSVTEANSSAVGAAASASDAAGSASAAAGSASSAWVDASGAATSESAAAASATVAVSSATLAQQWATKTDGPVVGDEYSAKYYAALTTASPKWATRGIGELVAVWDHIPGADIPPTDIPGCRYIKLSASDPYNAGVLSGESVSGSAPLLTATAVIALADSPLNGVTINLVNTERRGIRAGASGDVQDDALQKFALRARRGSGSVGLSADAMGSSDGSLSVGISSMGFYIETTANVVFDAPTGGTSVRTSTETRMRNAGATYYMRIL
ncbi:hypothetical protein AVE30378_01024 [Achromobacter veterisilvae]|uniref:Uncharacterized protein n=1 Tax=Achromobacter veterisilvae TaxID=2069367 RepID=A0A446C8R3_9BURK|nr:hypothetical protein [Achromobacter veterisilvae]SSW64322.1 hypothetical protein AVE30378_01024 [Achromobacter veterisilvae]